MSDDHENDPEHFRKLFIGGLSYKTTSGSLKSYFEQWGEIVGCVVMRDPHTRRSRGFGFITFKEARMVDDAQGARPHNIDGREVESKRAVPREDSGKPEAIVTVKKLFVGALKSDVEEHDLRGYFGQYGNIKSVHVVIDQRTKKKKGYALIEFDDYDPVDKAVLRQHSVKGKRVEVKKALSRRALRKMKRSRNDPSGGRGGWIGEWHIDNIPEDIPKEIPEDIPEEVAGVMTVAIANIAIDALVEAISTLSVAKDLIEELSSHRGSQREVPPQPSVEEVWILDTVVN